MLFFDVDVWFFNDGSFLLLLNENRDDEVMVIMLWMLSGGVEDEFGYGSLKESDNEGSYLLWWFSWIWWREVEG